MAYKEYIDLVTHFQALPTTVTDLQSVTVGSDEEDLNLQNSRIRYPLLRVDTPEIRFQNDDQTMATRYTFRFYVLTNEPRKTNEEENKALSRMEILCRNVILQLWSDADDDLFDLIPGDSQGDAIRHWSGDNDFGWWFTVTIDLYTDDCAT